MKEKSCQLQEQTKIFALCIIRMYTALPKTTEAQVLGKQVLRSGTSVGANYRAVCRARSERERYSKLCIVVEEADETMFWLEMMLEAGFLLEEKTQPIINEAEEILKVMSAFKNKLKG